MGCCTSRETLSEPAGNGSSSASASQARLTNNNTNISQTPLNQSTNQVHSPDDSRAALNANSSTSLPTAARVSSPLPSSNRHRHRIPIDTTSSNLSEHYNLPLQNPRAWKSRSKTWTPSQLRRERQDFFDTRVTGQKEVWAALRQVAECIQEGDNATAQGILNAANVTLPSGHIEDGCYDERGCLYRIPEEILSDPTNLQSDESEVDGKTVVEVSASTKAKLSSESLAEKGPGVPRTILEPSGMSTVDKGKETIPEDAIHLKCRLSDSGSDVKTYITKTEEVAALAARLKRLTQIPPYARIEIFYLGKKLDQKTTLEEQDYMPNHVLNVFVVGAPR